MDSRGFHTITLGCKLNQFDSAAIEGELGRRGYHPVADASRATVVVVNFAVDMAYAALDPRLRGGAHDL